MYNMKKFLPKMKILVAITMFTCSFLLTTTVSFAATKTWNGGAGPGKNWTTAGNWLPVGAPVAGDDIVFNTAGTITFSTMPASVSYNSLTISAGDVILVGGAACTLTLGTVPGDDLYVLGSLTIGSNVDITLASNANGKIDGTFNIGSGRNYNTDGAGVVTSAFGTISNAGTITSSVSKLLMQTGCAYIHSQNGGTVPTATWDVNSFCVITGLTTTHPAGGNQAFGNLTYDCAGMSTNLIMANGVSIAGTFTIENTGSARILMTDGSVTVGGDFNLNGASAFTVSDITDRTFTVLGDIYLNGGNFDLCSGGAANIGTLNAGGNLTNFAAITETGAGKGVINFTGIAAQTFNQSGALVNNVDFGINNTSGVTLTGSVTLNATLTLTSGRLNIPSGSTLTIASGNPIGGSGFDAGKHINTQVAGAAQGFIRIDNMAASTAYTIPTGNGTHYLPVTLTPPNTSSFSVGVFQGITEDGLPNGTAFTLAKKAGVVDAVYTINRNSGTLGVDMTLGWPTALEGSSFTTYTTSQIGIAHWDGPNWGTCVGTGDNALNTATRNGITVFSPFSVGKTPYLLPVKFSYLNAAKGNGYNALHWKAECSSSEVTFEILRSTDGINFSSVSSLTASQLRCAQPFDYIDNFNLPGTVFYRIKSTEITGQVTYSTIVKLTAVQKEMALTAVLPNPVISQAQLNIISSKKDVVDLVIVSMDGKMVQKSNVQLQAGSSIINLDVAALQSGVYLIRGIFSNGEASILKFIKQ